MINVQSLQSVSFSDLNALPDYSGIYIALDQDEDILYVGQAVNIRKRWVYHHRFEHLKEYGCVKIAWLKCDRAQLDETERTALLQLRPLLNGVALNSSGKPKQKTEESNLDEQLDRIYRKFYGENYMELHEEMENSVFIR